MTHLIRQIGYLSIVTPVFEEAAYDLTEVVGLRITDRSPDRVQLSANDRSCEIAFERGENSAVRFVGLEAMDAAAVEETARRVRAEGFTILDDRPYVPGVERAIRFATPFGPSFEVHTPVPRSGSKRHFGTGSRPVRFEHVNLWVPDTLAFGDFLTGTLGMRLSDRTEGHELSWYRAWDGFHHTIAVGQGNKMHHYAFDAASVQDLVHLADALVVKDRQLLWGPGRHGAGENIFTYYRDPTGCVVETSFGMMRVDNDDIYEPTVWALSPTSKVRNLWCNAPSAEGYRDLGLPYL